MQIVKLEFPKFGNFFSKFRNFISTIWKFNFQIKQKYFQKPVKSTFSIFCQKNIFFPLFGKNISIIFLTVYTVMLIYAKIMGKINALIKIIFECFCGHLSVQLQFLKIKPDCLLQYAHKRSGR